MATVVADPNFNAEKVAETLREAMKGFGTNEKKIIKALASCNSEQRQEVKTKFKVMYGKDLIENLKSELGGHFEDAVVSAMMTNTERDASDLRKAMKGAGTDESTLIEIMASRSNSEINNIKEFYSSKFKRDLEKDLVSETSGKLERILVGLVQAARPEGDDVDEAKAEADAQALYKAGEDKFGTDEMEFQRILMTCSRAQIKALCAAYSKLSKYELYRVIEKEFSGNLEKAYKAIIGTSVDPAAYYAERLYKSMHGVGTDDEALIRLVVSRSEVDMVDIKETFKAKYGKSLAKMIKDDCSGDYERFLLALIGEE